jgi:hypothetical protein
MRRAASLDPRTDEWEQGGSCYGEEAIEKKEIVVLEKN